MPQPAPASVRIARLGEELPIFCEKCGYSLHGLPSNRCERCDILHFVCPECGHHQPINTLRPAVQKTLGRLRSLWLVGSIFIRLNFFIWLLVAWVAMGSEWFHVYSYSANRYTVSNRPLTDELVMAFMLFALPWGIVSRMMLLRWRNSLIIGVILSLLTCAAIVLGAALWAYPNFERFASLFREGSAVIPILIITFFTIVIGCVASWWMWVAVARLFLPKATADALLAWQRALSENRAQRDAL